MHFGSFSITSSVYTKLVFRAYLMRYWWLYALPLAALIALTFYNINFIYTILVLHNLSHGNDYGVLLVSTNQRNKVVDSRKGDDCRCEWDKARF